MGLFRSCGFDELTTQEAGTMRAKWRKKYAQAEAQKEEDEGKVQVGGLPLPPAEEGNPLGDQPPHGVLRKSMGRLLSSKTSTNILPEVGYPEDRSFQEPCSVLQRDLKQL